MALAQGVTRFAARLEEEGARRFLFHLGGGCVVPFVLASPLPVRKPVAKDMRQGIGVVEGRAFDPLARSLVAHDQADIVVTRVVGSLVQVEPETIFQAFDIGLGRPQKKPPGPDLELLCVLLEGLRGIEFRIHGDGIHEDVPADAVAEPFVDRAKFRGLGGARVRAAGKDEVDRDHLVSQQVLVETNLLSFVGGQLDIGKPPVGRPGLRARLGGSQQRQAAEEDGERKQTLQGCGLADFLLQTVSPHFLLPVHL